MADAGYSFTPGMASRFRSSLNNPTGAGQLPQNISQALQVLSLHLPSLVGGAPIAPDALLRRSRGVTPDAAVRAQVSGSAAPAPPVSAPSAAPPSMPDSGLSVQTPSLGGSPPLANMASSALTGNITDSGPTPSDGGSVGSPNIVYNGPDRAPDPGLGPVSSPDLGNNSFMDMLNSLLNSPGSDAGNGGRERFI